MNTAYTEIPEIRYQLGMYGWIVKEVEDCLMVDMRGDIFYVPYSLISEMGADGLVRYCKARFTYSKNNYTKEKCNETI